MKRKTDINIRNRRASFDYELSDTVTAGIVLYGTEIKSVRDGRASLSDTYCIFENGELWVKNMQISAYRLGYYYNHDVKRDRKLLLNRNELRKLQRATVETGYTIVPTRLFVNGNGLAKLEIAVARGKKNYDKRQSLREQDDRRDMDRAKKIY